MMANASLCEFDISPVRVIKSWKLWNRTVMEGNMYWIRFQIQTRSRYSVPVKKDGRPHLSPQCYGLRLLLVPDFLDTLTRYIHTWKLDKTSCIRCLGSFGGSNQCLYSDLPYFQDVYTTADPFHLKLAKSWSFTATEETRFCFAFWQQRIWQAFHWLYSTSITCMKVKFKFTSSLKRNRNCIRILGIFWF